MAAKLPAISVAEQLAERIAALDADVPAAVREKCVDLLIDVAGLCVTARNEDYVRARSPPATMTGRARRSATRAGLSAAAPP